MIRVGIRIRIRIGIGIRIGISVRPSWLMTWSSSRTGLRVGPSLLRLLLTAVALHAARGPIRLTSRRVRPGHLIRRRQSRVDFNFGLLLPLLSLLLLMLRSQPRIGMPVLSLELGTSLPILIRHGSHPRILLSGTRMLDNLGRVLRPLLRLMLRGRQSRVLWTLLGPLLLVLSFVPSLRSFASAVPAHVTRGSRHILIDIGLVLNMLLLLLLLNASV